jgi:preprotein translocase subunit YajC
MNIVTKQRQQHSPEQTVRKIQDADRIITEGGDVAAVLRGPGVAEAT